MSELTWDNLEEYEGEDFEEAFEKLCELAAPTDFYIDVRAAEPYSMTTIFIVPKAYFSKHGYQYDQHINIESILPNDFGEDMECCYSSDRDVEEVKNDLLARGFEENNDFTKMIAENFE